jgi:hypothetical protein
MHTIFMLTLQQFRNNVALFSTCIQVFIPSVFFPYSLFSVVVVVVVVVVFLQILFEGCRGGVGGGERERFFRVIGERGGGEGVNCYVR